MVYQILYEFEDINSCHLCLKVRSLNGNKSEILELLDKQYPLLEAINYQYLEAVPNISEMQSSQPVAYSVSKLVCYPKFSYIQYISVCFLLHCKNYARKTRKDWYDLAWQGRK